MRAGVSGFDLTALYMVHACSSLNPLVGKRHLPEDDGEKEMQETKNYFSPSRHVKAGGRPITRSTHGTPARWRWSTTPTQATNLASQTQAAKRNSARNLGMHP